MNGKSISVASNERYEMKGASFSSKPAKLTAVSKEWQGTRRIGDMGTMPKKKQSRGPREGSVSTNGVNSPGMVLIRRKRCKECRVDLRRKFRRRVRGQKEGASSRVVCSWHARPLTNLVFKLRIALPCNFAFRLLFLLMLFLVTISQDATKG